MFIKIHMRPQPFFTYGQCVAYSDGTVERLVAVGDSVRFPSATNYLVSTDELVGLIRTLGGPEVRLLISDNVPAKRPCVRPLGIGGEQAEELEDKPKGASDYFLDLEGVKRPSRNKSDIPPLHVQSNGC
jgi:hypothetical protein